MTSESQQFSEVDVRAWQRFKEETLGTKPKRWLENDKSGELWLMKYRTFNPAKGGTEYPKGDDWAERVASEVALALGVPAAQCELAVDPFREGSLLAADPFGVLSRGLVNINDDTDEELYDGNSLLADVDVIVVRDGARKSGRKGYTLQAIRRALESVQPPVGWAGRVSAWDVFVGYLLLDALIGNTDRHEENWAAIRGENLTLAPSFDHASSLGFQLSDDDRKDRLVTRDQLRTPEAWAGRAHSCFEGGPHPVEVLEEALGFVTPAVREQWLDACTDIAELVAPIARIPEQRMTEPSREFAEAAMRANWLRIMGLRHT